MKCIMRFSPWLNYSPRWEDNNMGIKYTKWKEIKHYAVFQIKTK